MTRFTAAGDALILDRLPPNHVGFERVSKYLHRGDARIVNLETVLGADNCFGNVYSGGAWVHSPKGVLDDLLSYGFNLFAWANNHTMDFSYGGLQATRDCLFSKGVACAGAGLSLGEASMPVFINTDEGRVGMISLSDSIPRFAGSRAGVGHDGFLPRPGLNPLRFSVEYTVTKQQMKALRKIADSIGINLRVEVSRAQGFVVNPPEGVFDFGGIAMREGSTPGRKTFVNEVDMQRTERGIRSARLTCEYVVVTIHSHQLKGGDERETDYFVEDFCHRCIDAGASGVVGTGTHLLKGIEIYKSKPIFYSLGNFIFQLDRIDKQPAEFLEDLKYPLDMNGAEAIFKRSEGGTRGLVAEPVYYRSVIPYWEIENDQLRKLTLLPIELGFGKPKNMLGFPSAAEPELIMEDLATASKPYGTKYRVVDGLIEVVL